MTAFFRTRAQLAEVSASTDDVRLRYAIDALIAVLQSYPGTANFVEFYAAQMYVETFGAEYTDERRAQ